MYSKESLREELEESEAWAEPVAARSAAIEVKASILVICDSSTKADEMTEICEQTNHLYPM
jgi:hypothetical protein